MTSKKLKQLIEQREQLNAKISKQRQRIRSQKNKERTRKLILLGRVFDHMLNNIKWKTTKTRPWLCKHIDEVITRPADREFLASQGFSFLMPASDSEPEITEEDLEKLAKI